MNVSVWWWAIAPSPHEDAGLAVLGVDDVLGVEHGGAADVGGLLARRRHVERDAALALRVVEDAVHHVQRHHVLVHLLRQLLAHLMMMRAHDVRLSKGKMI
jgi:hypothetical protein